MIRIDTNPDAMSSLELVQTGSTLRLLADYTHWALLARNCRETGNIAQALKAEARMETIYAKLPEEVRW